ITWASPKNAKSAGRRRHVEGLIVVLRTLLQTAFERMVHYFTAVGKSAARIAFPRVTGSAQSRRNGIMKLVLLPSNCEASFHYPFGSSQKTYVEVFSGSA